MRRQSLLVLDLVGGAGVYELCCATSTQQKKISQTETVVELFKWQNLVKNLRAARDLCSKIIITFVHASVFLLL